MCREEFLRQFREALDGKVSENMIDENVNYYRSYINEQIASGRSESEVLRLLGEPRLLAKTIEESSKFASGKFTSESQGCSNGCAHNYEKHDSYDTQKDGIKERYINLPGWLITSLVMIAVVLVIIVLFNVFIYFAPFILIFLVVGFMVRTVRSWWNNK